MSANRHTLAHRAAMAARIAARRAVRRNLKRRTGYRAGNPVRYVGVQGFSVHDEQWSDEFLIEMVKVMLGFALADRKTRYEQGYADDERPANRPRLEGSYMLALVLYVHRREGSIRRFHATTPHATWHLMGFEHRPSLSTLRTRWRELEEHALGVLVDLATAPLVRRGMRLSGGVIGRDLAYDATQAQTEARVYHACPKGKCPRRNKKDEDGKERRSALPSVDISNLVGRRPGDDGSDNHADPVEEYDGPGRLFRLASTGCLYWVRDETAGLRSYRSSKSSRDELWCGWSKGSLVDVATGLKIRLLHTDASIGEADAYPELFEAALDVLGLTPRAVVADGALAMKHIGLLHARYDVDHIVHARGRGDRHDWGDDPNGRYDRNAILRCQHCGGPTTSLRIRMTNFATDRARRRLYSECTNKPTEACESEQSKYVDDDPRLISFVQRDSEAFHALFRARSNLERAHYLDRARYRTAPNSSHLRVRRLGVAWQQLRAEAAQFIDWMKFHWMMGWIDGERRIDAVPTEYDGGGELEKLELKRRDEKLHLSLPRFVRARAAFERKRQRERYLGIEPQDE